MLSLVVIAPALTACVRARALPDPGPGDRLDELERQ
jgi:hypothetical protein